MGRRKKNKGVCTYCGHRGKMTKDHVPPRSLFHDPTATPLVTVPCCVSCHVGTSIDDEYFRQTITLGGPASEHPDARAVGEKALRALHNPQKVGMAKSFVGSFTMAEMVTEAGIIIGSGPAYTYAPLRLEDVCSRIIAGLFYRDMGRRLPRGCEAIARMLGARDDEVEGVHRYIAQVATGEFSAAPNVLGADVLWYWCRFSDDVPAGSVWYLEFYKAVPFIGMTTAVERRSPRNAFGKRLLARQ